MSRFVGRRRAEALIVSDGTNTFSCVGKVTFVGGVVSCNFAHDYNEAIITISAGGGSDFSGDYNDLTNKPVLFDGAYSSLTGKPALFSGAYADLTGLPTLFDGTYGSLTGKPTLFDGTYGSLTGKPALFDGTYGSLTGAPSLAAVATTGAYSDLTGAPAAPTKTSIGLGNVDNTSDATKLAAVEAALATVATTGAYADLTGKPTLFNGAYSSLTGLPALFDGTWGSLTGKPSFATVATSGSASDLGTGTLPAARLPNPTSTTLGGVQSAVSQTNKFINSISTSGVAGFAQPTFLNLSGTLDPTQAPDIIMGEIGHRLTLTSGQPVLGGSVVAGAGTVYFSPHGNNWLPLWNGSKFVWTAVGEISNVLANTSVGSAGPFGAVPNAVYDLYAWSTGGVSTLTRSDMWQATGTVTNTNASPAVFTLNAHGMANGCPVRLNGGILSPGFSPNVTYFAVSVATNTFQLSATVGGAAINAGGASSGTITATMGAGIGPNDSGGCTTVQRGAANAQTRGSNGLLVNTNAITNGPGAAAGVYAGTIRTDSTGATVSWTPGSAAIGGGIAKFHVWNQYNQKENCANVMDSTATPWAYTSSTVRSANGNNNNRVSFVMGQAEDGITAAHSREVFVPTASAWVNIGIALDNTAAHDICGTSVVSDATINTGRNYPPQLGGHFIQATESGDNTHANTFAGTNTGPTASRGALTATMRG